jgi:hypothetical protein
MTKSTLSFKYIPGLISLGSMYINISLFSPKVIKAWLFIFNIPPPLLGDSIRSLFYMLYNLQQSFVQFFCVAENEDLNSIDTSVPEQFSSPT